MKFIDILAIDDEQVINDAIKRICATEDLSVQTVTTAEEGLELLSKEKFRLIVSDIMLPGLDGFQFLDELNSRSIKTPVIVISGFSTIENAVTVLKKGAIDFLPKPFTYEELMSGVHRGLEYSNILERISSQKPLETDNSIFNIDSDIHYVPCPPKYYRLAHISWLNITIEGTAIIGTSDLYLRTIKTVSKIELLEPEENIYQGISCVQIYGSDELQHPLLAPVSGKIIERNENLLKNPSLLEKDPYFKGWIYKIIPTDLEYERKFWEVCSSEII